MGQNLPQTRPQSISSVQSTGDPPVSGGPPATLQPGSNIFPKQDSPQEKRYPNITKTSSLIYVFFSDANNPTRSAQSGPGSSLPPLLGPHLTDLPERAEQPGLSGSVELQFHLRPPWSMVTGAMAGATASTAWSRCVCRVKTVPLYSNELYHCLFTASTSAWSRVARSLL